MKSKPLLIIQTTALLTPDRYREFSDRISARMAELGWACLILDGCSEQSAKVYTPTGQPIKEAAAVIADLKSIMDKLHEK